ncbi:MAG: beta-lactamase family protein [Asgard group archaeon]|nr:beta-lactamase family protein [Asgard group archaeon]
MYPEEIFQPAGGICSTIEDLIKFLQAHLYGNNILLPDNLKREMQRIQVKLNNNVWGLGFGLSNNPEGKIPLHMGGALGYRSMSGLIQDKKLIVTVFCNGLNVGIDGFFFGLCHLIEVLNSLQGILWSGSNDIPDFKDINGFYSSLRGWGPELFWQIGSKLVLLNPENKYPGGSMQILNHKKDLIFTPSRETPSAKPGEDIEFIDGPDGDKIYLDSKKREHKKFEYNY